MAPSQLKPVEKKQLPPKLKRLPSNTKIEKRPILHPAIPSPYTNASQPKIIYVSSKTPFISVVKRVRKLLSLIDKRSIGKFDLLDGKGNDKQKLRELEKRAKEPEEVFLKATNKAIEKVLGFALFFQGQEDCRVRIKTGSIGVVDDIVEIERLGAPGAGAGDLEDADHAELVANKGRSDIDMEGTREGEELPETQIRKASTVEVGISLR